MVACRGCAANNWSQASRQFLLSLAGFQRLEKQLRVLEPVDVCVLERFLRVATTTYPSLVVRSSYTHPSPRSGGGYPARNESTASASSFKLLTFNTLLHSGAYLGMSLSPCQR